MPALPTELLQIAHDPELLKDELRPLVFDEVRQQVDDEMRCLLANLKAMVAAEAAAKSGGSGACSLQGGTQPPCSSSSSSTGPGLLRPPSPSALHEAPTVSLTT